MCQQLCLLPCHPDDWGICLAISSTLLLLVTCRRCNCRSGAWWLLSRYSPQRRSLTANLPDAVIFAFIAALRSELAQMQLAIANILNGSRRHHIQHLEPGLSQNNLVHVFISRCKFAYQKFSITCFEMCWLLCVFNSLFIYLFIYIKYLHFLFGGKYLPRTDLERVTMSTWYRS